MRHIKKPALLSTLPSHGRAYESSFPVSAHPSWLFCPGRMSNSSPEPQLGPARSISSRVAAKQGLVRTAARALANVAPVRHSEPSHETGADVVAAGPDLAAIPANSQPVCATDSVTEVPIALQEPHLAVNAALEAPVSDSVTEARRQAAASSMRPGGSTDNKRRVWALWEPKKEKPKRHHLAGELSARGVKVSANWSCQLLVDKLYLTAPLELPAILASPLPGIEDMDFDGPRQAETTSDPQGAAVQNEEADSVPATELAKKRWSAVRQGVRLLHCIVHLPEEFLRRNQPLRDREAVDAGAQNIFFEKAAKLFCDPEFKPEKLISSQVQGEDIEIDIAIENFLDKCDPGYTAYALDAEGFKARLNDLKKTYISIKGR